MRRLLFFWLFFLFINGMEVAHAQSIILQGIVLDDSTNSPISEASFQLLDKENHLLRSTMTSAKGGFTFQSTENIHLLTISKSGYYPFQMNVYFSGNLTNDFKPNFYVPVKLSRIPAQHRDKPYEQETQRHIELGKDTAARITFSRKFTFVNSETNRPVKAELCLIPTRTGRRECVSVSEGGSVVSFENMDITALEVKSEGFNDFYGNLIMTNSEEPTGEYLVRLRPVRPLVSIFTELPTDSIYFLNDFDLYNDHFQKNSAHSFFLSTPKTGRFLLKMITLAGHFQRVVFLQSGLNLIGLSDNSDPVCEVLHRGERMIVYFPQSSYVLSAEAKVLLDQLASCTLSSAPQDLAIVGHTEPVGNEKLNKTLSEFRAKVVANYLVGKGLVPDQLHNYGVGSTQPAAPGPQGADPALNRRVEIFLKH